MDARLAIVVGLASAAMACGKRGGVETPAPQSPGTPEQNAVAVPGPEVLRLYDDAASLDPLRLTALASEEGLSALLVEAGREPRHRRAVLAALPYTKRLAAADYLAQVAISGDKESGLAYDSLLQLSALVDRNDDSDDLVELRRGCGLLVKLVETGDGNKGQRARAMSALRVLSQHGCSVPTTTDYDAP